MMQKENEGAQGDIPYNNRIKIARKMRGLGPRCRSAAYAKRYASKKKHEITAH